ncbi:MAG: MATE family efflux transporter, partial [Propionibacteriaceae bacterium]|nr:MATE family efflux transporter [Propionibacteriaceae bacterium]
MSQPERRALDREILALAVPAFATLITEPLLTMADAAITGHISTTALAGLGAAAVVVNGAVGLCVFLAYGTTGQVARQLGAGQRRKALAVGLDGISLGLAVGVVLLAALEAAAGPVIGLFGVDAEVAAQAVAYLRVVAFGLPAALSMLAATGVLRGLQDTRTPLWVAIGVNLFNIALSLTLVFGLGLGIAGAALGTAVSQWAGASLLAGKVIRTARRERVAYRWNPGGVLLAARSGFWLFWRTVGLQAAVITTTWVAARLGRESLAAHQ